MKLAKFSVACNAVYSGTLKIPDSVTEGNELTYIRNHLSNVPVVDLEWLEDLSPEEAVTEDDIRSIEEIEGEELDL